MGPALLANSGGGGVTGTTWDTVNNGGSFTFSNGNLTANKTATNGGRVVISTTSRGSGKWYFEILPIGGGNPSVYPGILSNPYVGGDLTNDLGAGANSYSIITSGASYHNSSANGYAPGISSGNVIMIALDLVNGKVFWGNNGTWASSGNPATGANPGFTGLSGSFYAAASVGISGSSATARFTSASFSYSPPSGFSEWG